MRGNVSENSGWDLHHVNNRRACRVSGSVSVFGRARTLSFCVLRQYEDKAKAERDVIVIHLLKSCYYIFNATFIQDHTPGIGNIATPDSRLLYKSGGSHDRTGLRAAEKGAGRGVTDRRNGRLGFAASNWSKRGHFAFWRVQFEPWFRVRLCVVVFLVRPPCSVLLQSMAAVVHKPCRTIEYIFVVQ